MKKTLFVLSAISLAAAAHAQSSVTLSGTVDATFTRGTGSIADRTVLGSGGNATSKLTFRGTEDLGGGMSANFWLETGFTADDGQFQNTNTNNQTTGVGAAVAGRQGLTFNRRSDVYLVAPWGEFHAGRLWNVNYEPFTTKYDPFGVGVGLSAAYTYSLQGSAATTNIRVSNALRYDTPKFGGFGAQIAYWLGENASNAANSDDGKGTGIRLYYDNGPFSAIGSYTRTKFVAGDMKAGALAAAYTFGPGKVSMQYTRDELGAFKDRGWLIAGWWYLGAGELKASYSTLRTNAAGDPRVKKLAIGYVHNLSKRTAVYTTIARNKNSGGAAIALGGATTAANGSSTGFDLGLRHNF